MSTPPSRSYDSCVYFARCGRYVKIGFSSHPELRLSHIRRYSTVPVDFDPSQPAEMIHLISDCRMRDERIIHALFDRYRVAGEWFTFSLPFLHQLASLRYQTDRARARHAFLVRAELKKVRQRQRAA